MILNRNQLEHYFARASRYVSTGEVSARPAPQGFQWTTEQGDVLTAEDGDWLVSDGINQWTVGAEIFAATYTQTTPGHYRKTAPVNACVLPEATEVSTREGVVSGLQGDYLVQNVTGDVWIVPREEFERKYRLDGLTCNE